MAKKQLKDYTPEQRWKIQRRLIRLDKETQKNIAKLFKSTAKSYIDAVEFKKESDTMGGSEFLQWCKENPLSPQAQLSLITIEEQLAAPDREVAKNTREKQKKFREDRQRLEEEKHRQWRKWQADEKSNNPQFARQSKQEQAKRLREKHSINEMPDSIAKRLEPLPPSKSRK